MVDVNGRERALVHDVLVWDNTLPWGSSYADGDVCAILGGNWLRLAREVWR